MNQNDDMKKAPASPEKTPIKPQELVQRIKTAEPKVMSGVPEKKAVRLIRLAMQQLAEELKAAEAGVVRVPGLGVFRVRQVERTKDGDTQNVRRIVFTPANPKRKAKD